MSSGKLAFQPTLTLSLYCFIALFTESSALRVWLLIHPHSTGHIPAPPLLSVLDYSLLFLLFSFVGVGGQSAQGWHWIMFLRVRGWVGKSWVVHDAHLFILQIHASSFETSWQGEMVWHRKVFHGLGVQDVTEFDSN
jgi:hypothetical protein